MLSPQYTAGLFDGEGCINIWMTKTGYCQIRATLCMVEKPIIDMFKDSFGGCVTEIKKENDKWRDCWVWKCNGKDLMRFLEYIEPFCIVKKKQVAVGLKMRELIGYSGRLIPEEIKDKRIELKNEMHALNRRGK